MSAPPTAPTATSCTSGHSLQLLLDLADGCPSKCQLCFLPLFLAETFKPCSPRIPAPPAPPSATSCTSVRFLQLLLGLAYGHTVQWPAMLPPVVHDGSLQPLQPLNVSSFTPTYCNLLHFRQFPSKSPLTLLMFILHSNSYALSLCSWRVP